MFSSVNRVFRRNVVSLSGNEVRASFLRFFEQNGHKIVASGNVIADEKELAFVNAGMNQFKPIILGQTEPEFKRVANSQKCIRTGGKHNDLADVGRDKTHQTFFEMLGNWSFGDYYNKEACRLAWAFLTDVLKIEPSRLYVSYFSGDKDLGLLPDLECKQIWLDLGVKEDHIVPADIKSNFWEMADRGPCGPCTEIHIDRRTDRNNASHLVNVDGSDVVELWNLVFMQYNRVEDKKFTPLPVRHIDCGMGFERLTSVVQNVDSNYETDLFTPLLKRISELSGLSQKYSGNYGPEHDLDTAYRTLADHIRAVPIALADGANPKKHRFQALRSMIKTLNKLTNEDLNMEKYALLNLVDFSIDNLSVAFPELKEQRTDILSILEKEEKAYHKKLREAELAFFGLAEGLKPGDVFKADKLLYAHVNHGCTQEMAREFGTRKGYVIEEGFDELFEEYKRSGYMPYVKNKLQKKSN